MNDNIIKSVFELLESKGIEATKEQVFSLLIISVKETFNLSTKDAVNMVLGENTYEKLVDHLYKQFTERV
jgi:hypothetical protein